MSTHKNIFFYFFLQTGGSNLQRRQLRTIVSIHQDGSRFSLVKEAVQHLLDLPERTIVSVQGRTQRVPNPIHPDLAWAARPAGPDSEQLCVFGSRIRLDSLPIPMPPLLPDQPRTLKTNNCEHTACSRKLGQLRFPMLNLLPAQAAALTPNNCRYSPRCRRLEPDPIPITCT